MGYGKGCHVMSLTYGLLTLMSFLPTSSCSTLEFVGVVFENSKDVNLTENTGHLLENVTNDMIKAWQVQRPLQYNLTISFRSCSIPQNGTNIVERLGECTKPNNSYVFISLLPLGDPTTHILADWTKDQGIPVIEEFTERADIASFPSVISMNPSSGDLSIFILSMIKYLRWNYVQVVVQDTNYFNDALASLVSSASTVEFCVLTTFRVSDNSTVEEIRGIIHDFHLEKETKGVILLLDSWNTRRFFEVLAASVSESDFHFITSSVVFDSHALGILSIDSARDQLNYSYNGIDYLDQFPQLPGILSAVFQVADEVFFVDTVCSIGNSTSEERLDCTLVRFINRLHIFINSLEMDVYNRQLNNSKHAWKKVGIVNHNRYTALDTAIFYDQHAIQMADAPVSNSDPYRYECRKSIAYNVYLSNPADVYVVGVLPIHDKSPTPTGCGNLNFDNAILSEAVAFAVNQINENPNIFPGTKLGFAIIDYCSVPERVIGQLDDVYGHDTQMASRIVAAIGFPDSENFMEMSGYLTSRNLLTLSTTANSPKLSDKEKYPNFMRMASSSSEEVYAILEIVKEIGVDHIGIAFTDHEDEDSNVLSLMKQAEAMGISVGYILRISDQHVNDENFMDNLVNTFIQKNVDVVRTVVCFTDMISMKAMLNAVQRTVLPPLLWIGSDKLYSSFLPEDLYLYETVIENAIVISFRSHELASFVEHMSLISNNTSNPFIAELLKNEHICRRDDNVCLQQSHTTITDISEHSDATFVVDAINAVANGYKVVVDKFCKGDGLCNAATKDLMGNLAKAMYDNPFLGSSLNQVIFDSKFNGPIVYDIYQASHRENEGLHYKKIGTFDVGKLVLNHSAAYIPEFVKHTDECKEDNCLKLPPDLLETSFAFIDGDPMIYAFVALHRSIDSQICSKDILPEGFQEAEALLWSVDKINRDNSLLRNVTLGLTIFDTCKMRSKTEHLIQSILHPGFTLPSSEYNRYNVTTLGMVGGIARPEAVGMEIGTRVVDKEVPVIVSASVVINDGQQHPRLFRTVLSPFERVNFIIDMSLKFGWTFIHLIHGTSDNVTMNTLEDIAKSNGICIATRIIIGETWEIDDFEKALLSMQAVEGANAVFSMVPPPAMRNFWEAASNTRSAGKLFFIFPGGIDNFDRATRGLESEALGVITVRQNLTTNQQFMKHIYDLDIDDNHNLNPWFPVFWEEINKCNLKYSTKYDKECISTLTLSGNQNIVPNKYTTLMINSVYSLSKALDDYLHSCVNTTDECIRMNPQGFYSELDKYLSKVKVTPPGGLPFHFKQKNGTLALIVMNLQPSPDGNTRLVDIGEYHQGKLTLDTRKISFYRNGQRFIPKSTCPGFCKPCMDQALIDAYETKVASLISTGAVLTFKLNDALGTLALILVGIGIIFLIVASYYLQQNYIHKVFNLCIDASSGLLVGSLLMIVSSVGFLFSQTQMTCTIQLGLPGISYSICFGSLLVKLNKAAALREVVGTKQVKVPRWAFLFTYLPVMSVAHGMLFYAWISGSFVELEYFVPSINDISTIEDVTIEWWCTFDRPLFALHMAPFWFVIVETMLLSLYYRLRQTKQPEVTQVLASSIVSSVMLLIPTLVVTLSKDVDVYCTIMVIVLTFNGMFLVLMNFMPGIFVLMEDESKLHGFTSFVMREKASNIAMMWKKENKSRRNKKLTDKLRKAVKDKPGIEEMEMKESSSAAEGTVGQNRWKKGIQSLKTLTPSNQSMPTPTKTVKFDTSLNEPKSSSNVKGAIPSSPAVKIKTPQMAEAKYKLTMDEWKKRFSSQKTSSKA